MESWEGASSWYRKISEPSATAPASPPQPDANITGSRKAQNGTHSQDLDIQPGNSKSSLGVDEDIRMASDNQCKIKSEKSETPILSSKAFDRVVAANHFGYRVETFNPQGDGMAYENDAGFYKAVSNGLQRDFDRLKGDLAQARARAEEELDAKQKAEKCYHAAQTCIHGLRNSVADFEVKLQAAEKRAQAAESGEATSRRELANSKAALSEHIANLRRCMDSVEWDRKKVKQELLNEKHSRRQEIRSLHVERASLKQGLALTEKVKIMAQRDLEVARQKAASRIASLESHNSKLMVQNSNMMKQIAGTAANSSKVSDDTIHHHWVRLSYNIENLTDTVLTRPSKDVLYIALLGGRFLDKMRWSVPNLDVCLMDDDERPALLRAYIWRRIVETTLADEWLQTSIWAGTLGRQFKGCVASLTRCVPSGPSHLQGRAAAWRAEGATILEESLSGNVYDEDAIVRMATCMSEELAGFMPDPEQEMGECATPQALQEHLAQILRDAAHIQSMFMQSKAIFAVGFPVDGFQGRLVSPEDIDNLDGLVAYDDEIMEAEMPDKDFSPHTNVKFAISPMVTKTGSADGEGYDKTSVAVKAKVVCY